MFQLLHLLLVLQLGQPMQNEIGVQVHASSDFEELVGLYKRVNFSQNGYRIQIFNGSRKDAEKRRAEMLRTFEDLPVYLSYDAPEYRVQVGDFMDRIHAQHIAQMLKSNFSSAFVIASSIESPSWEESNAKRHFQKLEEDALKAIDSK